MLYSKSSHDVVHKVQNIAVTVISMGYTP